MKNRTFKGFDFVPKGVCAPRGFQAAGIHCGMRKNRTKKDLALIYSPALCSAAACYTQNKVKGAPIAVTKRHLENGFAQAVLVNSGNANTCNADGEQKAEQMCSLAAKALGIRAEDVIVASTGVIGQPLPLEPIAGHMEQLVKALSNDGSSEAAEGILTLDSRKKELAVSFDLNGTRCTIGGIAKGSGMVHPNMATILCFMTTDADIEPALLQKALSNVVNRTFNMISIDGDTSTNDTCAILASGRCGGERIVSEDSEEFLRFSDALYVLLMNLSRLIAADGEGATRLLECIVNGALDEGNARIIARGVITSKLFKCAMFGGDANWGRILCSIGYSRAELDISKVEIVLASRGGAIQVCKNGSGLIFDEDKAAEILLYDEIKIIVNLGDGDGRAVAWGCDLSYDYVRINGDYRKEKKSSALFKRRDDMEEVSNSVRAQILVNALPYIQKYNNKIIVVKYGGNAMTSDELKQAVMTDVVLLSLIGVKVVLVHGGGPEINDMLKKIGKESKFINGLRYTDKETAEIVQMVLAGKVNKSLVALLHHHGGRAIGLCGTDGGMISCEKKKSEVDLGYVGEITDIDTTPIVDSLDKGYIPVISTVATDANGEVYNINADTAAAKIAAALGAENLILMTDIRGLLRDKDDESTLIPAVNVSDVPNLIRQGIISGGMIPKIECCVETIRRGVGKAFIIDGRIPHSILIELLSNEGIGTMFI